MPQFLKPDAEVHGWKEIANFLGVSVRTAQTFEKDLSLPVHRRLGIKAPVYAKVAELDVWKDRQIQLSPKRSDSGVVSPAPVNPSANPQPQTHEAEITTPVYLHRRDLILRVGAGTAVLSGIAVVGSSTIARLWRRMHEPAVACHVQGATLIVLGRSATELWRYTFPTQLYQEAYTKGWGQKMYVFCDVDGDGRVETIFHFAPIQAGDLHRLVCFSSDGNIIWEFTPARSVTGRDGHTFEPPLFPYCFEVTKSQLLPTTQVTVSSPHNWSYPCQVAVLDGRTGKITSEYWHRGHLWLIATADLDGDGEPEVLLGGVNDAPEYKCATMIVFNQRQIAGASRDPKGSVYFQGMQPGTEKVIVYFPKTPISEQQEFNRVVRIGIESGRVMVVVAEGIAESAPYVTYEFDYRLQPVNASLGGTLIERYKQLQATGSLPRVSPDVVAQNLRKNVRVIKA